MARRELHIGWITILVSVSSAAMVAFGGEVVPARCEVSVDRKELLLEVTNLSDREGVLWEVPHFVLRPKKPSEGRQQRISAHVDPRTGKHLESGRGVEIPIMANQRMQFRIPWTGLKWTDDTSPRPSTIEVDLTKVATPGVYRLSFGVCASSPGVDVEITSLGELRAVEKKP